MSLSVCVQPDVLDTDAVAYLWVLPYSLFLVSISCSFLENLAKSYVGAPRRVGAPSYENPGSAPGKFSVITLQLFTTSTVMCLTV